MQQLGYWKLERSLIDVIKEEQAKLGYYKEDIRLYYPLSSLNHFFDTQTDEEEMQRMLDGMKALFREKLGEVEVSHRQERFCFHIPAEGVEYVYKNTEENEFIIKLVKLVARHGCTTEQIYDLFLQQSERVHREKVEHGEFDELLYFEDDSNDPYYYCFKQEGEHMIYHRFLPEDYADFEF